MADWSRTHPAAHALALDELSQEPYLAERTGGLIDVVFEGKAGSRLWKDVLVAFVHDVPTVAGLTRECFYDLVAGRPHAGSVRRQA